MEAQEQQLVTPQNLSGALLAPVAFSQPSEPGCNQDLDASVNAPEQADPGCLDDKWPENNNNNNYEQELEAIFEATQLDNLQVAVHFIQALQSASLDNKHNNIDLKLLHQLRNLPKQTFDIKNNFDPCLGLDTFLVSMNSSVDTHVTM
jgi:hypothetical protein